MQGNSSSTFYQKVFPAIEVNNSGQNSKAGFLLVLLYTVALAAAAYVINAFNVMPSAGIIDIAKVFVPGFFIYSFLPNRYRPFFYCLVFVACAFFVLSWLSAMLVIGALVITALVLYSDIAWRWKLVYLILLFASLIVINRFYMPRANIAAVYIAAILMFRVIILMYEMKYAKLEDNHWLKLSYLLCFPNLSFLFFPIIDYKTYVRSYYADTYPRICNRAMWYIMLAVSELLLYKIIAQYLNPTVSSVHDIYTLSAFFISKYLLVIKMVGILTLGVGVMMMFGFNMPAPFGNFFISFSFSEYWQKVNAYWRAFVLKVIYYPIYFKYRKKLKKNAVTVGIMCAFLCSYVLHSYQKFWIAGNIAFQLNDLLYWMLLGLLVMWNYRRNEGVSPQEKKNVSLLKCVVNGLNYVIVLLVMILLWNLWNSENVPYFFYVFSKGLHADAMQALTVTGILLVIVAAAGAYSYFYYSKPVDISTGMMPQKVYAYGLLAVLCALAIIKPGVQEGKGLYYVMSVKESVNKDDAERREAGYYESIISTKNEDWEVGMNNLNRRSFIDASATPSNDLLLHVLKPGAVTIVETPAKGRPKYEVKTNTYGMRDHEYSMVKPGGTYRIAILGGSYEMGTGVNNEQVFEEVAEKKLNAYYRDDPRVELMNFGVWGYTLIQEMELMKQKVPAFKPDAIMVFCHTNEYTHGARNFTRYIRNGIPLKYEYLQQIKKASGVKQSMSETEIENRLRPYMDDMYKWCYHVIDSICIKENIKPLFVFLPITNEKITVADAEGFMQSARNEGFATYSLLGAYKDVPVSKLAISEYDNHPTPLGHELIADKLFTLLIDSTNHIITRR